MKRGQVSDHIDGRVVSAGPAFDPGYTAGLRVIGDGSPYTGKGSMTAQGV